MAHDSKRAQPVTLVILSAGSGVIGSSTLDAGNDTSSSAPERTVQAPSPTVSASSSEGSSVTDDELGIIVGGGLMILVMISILFVGHRRRRRMDKDVVPAPTPGTLEASTRRSPAADTQGMYVLDNGSYLSSSISFGSRASCFLQEEPEACETWNHPVVLAVRVSVSEISLDELVARGTNSEVYRGQYRDQVVAIKKPLPQWLGDRKNVDAFFEQVRMLTSPALTHPGIVSFLCVSWRSLVYVCMVSEFMAGGDLRSFLSRRQHQACGARDDFARRGFCRQKVYLASQIASALSFLHAQGLVHGAVRSQNVLLDENLNAKLTGFQGSSIQPAIDRRSPSHDATAVTPVPPKLLTTSVPIAVTDRLRRERTRLGALCSAPEVLRGERSSAQTDIFSFGVVVSELDSLSSPYGHSGRFGEYGDSAELLEKVAAGHARVHFASSRGRHGRRGSSSPAEVDARLTAAVVRLGKACVALDAVERPSAALVSSELHKLLQSPDPKLSRTLSKQGP
ncbi:hypothetical protein PR003_g12583 [Phytophthora rubi]|uniref:Protein kinase domain-containing protein n=1 Tax=Phytophthora rubi TaxID=129364 RepID=A0A6A3LB28_9STRA|nr:hypothetical protein PR002_g13963 [Phytophthora rubi]KAE9033760.1 hypothetical protein PR001_g10020 [Phytophthora rubi]KAE9336284.1 hypothetical protein PR003_g12583 [Phytophthora rubi]